MELLRLMDELKKGNRRALTPIYEETKRAVFAVAYSILKSEFLAQDVMQETYIKVCQKIGSFRNDVSPKAWISTIARNIALDMMRRDRRLTAFNDNIATDNDYNKIDDKIYKTDLLKIAKEILNETEYQILYMHTIGDMKHQEIASVLKKSYATVRWNYANAIKKMQKKLGVKG